MRFPVWIPMTPMGGYVPPPPIVRGEGVHVWDEAGRRYLDAASGLWNVSLGHGHPAVVAAAQAQLGRLAYTPTFRGQTTPAAVELAGRLLELAGMADGRVFFATSGGYAVDTALKLVRRWPRLCGSPGRDTVLALHTGYHGTTYGATAVSGQDLDQDEYLADRSRVVLVRPDDVDDLRRVLDQVGDRLAGAIVEPVLGNSAMPLSAPFVELLHKGCDRADALVVVDEVATGLGRTGTMLASGQLGLRPDVLLLSKALTNGALPLSAVVASSRVCDAFDRPGCVLVHGETQSANPVAVAAALAVLDVMSAPGFLDPVTARSAELDAGLRQLVDEHPAVSGTRGLGLMRSLQLRYPDGRDLDATGTAAVLGALALQGVLGYASERGIALLPPLVLTAGHVDEILEAVEDALDRSLA